MRRTTLLALAAIAAIVAVPSAQAHKAMTWQARASGSGGTVVASGLDESARHRTSTSMVTSGSPRRARAEHGTVRRRPRECSARRGNSCFGTTGAFTRRPQRLAEARRHGTAVDRRSGHGRAAHRRRPTSSSTASRRRPDRRGRQPDRSRAARGGRPAARCSATSSRSTRGTERSGRSPTSCSTRPTNNPDDSRRGSTRTPTACTLVTAATSSRTPAATTCSA